MQGCSCELDRPPRLKSEAILPEAALERGVPGGGERARGDRTGRPDDTKGSRLPEALSPVLADLAEKEPGPGPGLPGAPPGPPPPASFCLLISAPSASAGRRAVGFALRESHREPIMPVRHFINLIMQRSKSFVPQTDNSWWKARRVVRPVVSEISRSNL